jgi:hypothetical protein
MRRSCGWALVVTLLGAIAVAAEPKPVQEIDARKFAVKRSALRKINEPIVVNDERAVADLFEGDHPLKADPKAVDFKTQQVLFFAWQGSGGDQLKAVPGDKEITFEYRLGRTRDLRAHFHFFVIPKGMKYEIKMVP